MSRNSEQLVAQYMAALHNSPHCIERLSGTSSCQTYNMADRWRMALPPKRGCGPWEMRVHDWLPKRTFDDDGAQKCNHKTGIGLVKTWGKRTHVAPREEDASSRSSRRHAGGETRGDGANQCLAAAFTALPYRDDTWTPETHAALIKLTAIPRLRRGLTAHRRPTLP
jgi:hypothetical protein